MVKGDYRPDYSVTTAHWKTASAVVRLFRFALCKMNDNQADYGSQLTLCSHPVVTRKPAEIRRFLTLTTITTSILKKKEKRGKKTPQKVTRANGGQVVTLRGVVR